ncbi:hypothetical protein [Actinokineospora diospyrosa]|uniref:Leucine rich repeat (LRR) protein n=1 Tax=Actinokineospora diospyrosa TaxID=103728 RepID=A0ABT1I6P2_9PSEU|nr:hypothetical protein [Actinokineospora diospyrosa]MCP2268292.1 hypothetical protein [Actinokineospora diospyrosa]
MSRPEIAKLARLLGEPVSRFDYLVGLSAEDIRAIRTRATEVLFGGNKALFDRIALASRLVPAALTAAIAQRTFGPLLSARVASALDPTRAIDLVSRLPVTFLADVAAELDPRRIAPVLAVLPVDKVIQVGTELANRQDHITMGRFVGDLPAPTLRALVTSLDEESLLHTAIYTDNPARLPDLFALIPDTRLPAVATTIASTALIDDLLPLLTHLDHPSQSRLATALRDLPPTQRHHLSDVAQALGVLESLGPIGSALA